MSFESRHGPGLSRPSTSSFSRSAERRGCPGTSPGHDGLGSTGLRILVKKDCHDRPCQTRIPNPWPDRRRPSRRKRQLEAVRVCKCWGKKGSISALPLNARQKCRRTNARRKALRSTLPRTRFTPGHSARAARDILKSAALDARGWASENHRRHPAAAARPLPNRGRNSSAQPRWDGTNSPRFSPTWDLPSPKGRISRTDDYKLHKTEFPRRPSRRRGKCHDHVFFFQPKEDGLAHAVAYPPPRRCRFRTMLAQKPPIRIICPRPAPIAIDSERHPYAASFQPGRGASSSTRARISATLKWILHEFCKAVLRGRSHQHAISAVVLSVHRAVARGSTSSAGATRGENPFRRRRRIGWRFSAAAWWHPNVLRRPAGIDPKRLSRPFAWGPWAIEPYRDAENTACPILRQLVRKATCAGSIITASSRSTSRRWRED